MSFVGLQTFFTSIVAAQTIEPSTVGFWGNLFAIVGVLFMSLWQAICALFYTVCMWFLSIVDFLQYFIQKLIGLDYWLREGNKTFRGAIESDLLFSFLYNDTVQNVFRAMIGVFFLLLIVFTIFAIIKQEWTFATGGFEGGDGNSKVKILRNSMKAIALVLVFPLILVIGIISSNAILASLVNALSIDMKQTFGSTLFSIASQSANKYRVYADDESRSPVTQEVSFYVDTSGNTIAYSDGSVGGGKYTTYISNHKTYLEKINSSSCTKYTVNTIFELVNPKKESSFSGYCISMPVDGKNTYFMVKCSSKNKTAMYYYLRNQLEVNIMTKNGSAAGNKAMAADGNTYRNIYANLKNRFESTGKQAFITSINLTGYGDDTSLIQACYNTWGYSSVYKNRQDFSVTTDYNVVGSSVLDEYGINGLSSAKVLFNSGEISSYFDGGQFGVVQKQSEYRVMADVIDFMNEYGVKLYMIDATSSMVKWNMTDYTAMGSRWVTDRINSSTGVSEGVTYAGEKVLPFVVSYSDICIDIESGNVLYTPKFNRNSELDGTVYIMCWKYIEGTTAKYVPLLNGVRYTDPYSKDTYTFKSDYLAGSYNGVIVAKGTFETNSTNSNLGEPTYIQTTATTGNATIDEALANSDEMYYYKMENRGYMKPYFKDNASAAVQYTNITGVELSSDFEGITVNNQNVGSEVVWKAVQSVKQADGTSKVIEKSFNPAMIQSITVRLRESRYTYATYAGQTFSSSDGETYYLFCTADQKSYFVISPDKVDGYIRIMGLESNGSVIESGVGGHLKTLKHEYTFEYYYNIDGISGTENSTGVKITPNYFTYAKTENGKSLFQTVDMQYITIKNGSSIIYQEGMYVNAAFNTTATNLITFDQNSKLVKFAAPEPSSSDNTYVLAFYKFNLYNYYTGVTGNNTSPSYFKYDIGSKTVNSYSGGPGMTFEFRIGVNDFAWDKKSDNLGLYDGKLYVGTIYKAIDQEIANTDINTIFTSLNGSTTSVLYDGKTYYNIITQNKFANTSEMTTHYNNIRDSLIVGFYRDNAGGIVGSSNWLSTQGIESDINIALFGGWRWKMSMMPQKMTNADMAGYFTLEDGVGFDYFFERSSLDEDNNEGVGFDTFFMPSKVSYWLILIASALIIKILGTSLWGVIKRFYQITLYFVAMPAVASTIVFDDGERFKTTIQMPLITQVLSTYGVILGINMFFVLLAPVRSMSNIFTEADMQASGNLFLKYLPIGPKLLNNFVYILFMLVAFTMIDALPKAISQILTPGQKDNNIAETGKTTMNEVGQAMKGAGDMISGRSLMKGASKVAGVAGDLFRPAHALVGGVANKAKGFLKGGGGKGEDDGSGRDEDENEGGNEADGSFEADAGQSAPPPPDTTVEDAGGAGGQDGKDGEDSDAANATFEAQNAVDPMDDVSDINMTGEVTNAADGSMEAPVDGSAREDDSDAMEGDVPLSEKLKQVRDEHEDGEYEDAMTQQGAEFKANAQQFGDTANETITEGGKALNESITEGGKAAGDAMGQTGDELMQSGQEMMGEGGLVGVVGGAAMVAAGAVTKGAGTVVEKGSDLAGTAVEKGADVVGDVVEKGADAVGAVGEQGMIAAGKAADTVVEKAPEIVENLEEVGDKVKDAVGGRAREDDVSTSESGDSEPIEKHQDFAIYDDERRQAANAMTDQNIVDYAKEKLQGDSYHASKMRNDLGLKEDSTDEEVLEALNGNNTYKKQMALGAASRDERFKHVFDPKPPVAGHASTGSVGGTASPINKRGSFAGGGRRARRGDPQGANAAAFGQITTTENAIMQAHTAKKHPIKNFGKKHPKLKKAAKVAGLLGAAAVAGAFIPGTTLALMAGGGFLAYKAGKGIARRVKKTVKGAKQFAKNVGRSFKRAGRAVVTGAMAGAAGLAVTTLSGGNIVAGALVAGAIVSKRRKAKKASNTSRTRFAKKAGGTTFTHAGDGAEYTAPESKSINGTKGVTVANEVVPHDAASGAPKTTGAKVAAVANGDVAPEEVEDVVAVAEYNRQAIDDRDVVDDTVGARANVVKNKVGSKVGRLIAARTLADYGEEDAGEDASMQDKMDVAINGTEVENADGTKTKKEGLLTNSMRLQAIRSTLTGKSAEDFDAMSAEDQEKQLSAYNVASSIGLDGKIGFSVAKKGADGTVDESSAVAVEQSVSDNIVSQMLSSDKVGDEAINVAIDEINAGSKVDAALAQNLSLGVDYNAQNAGTATSMLSKSIYDKASQDEDIVAEAMLRHIESDKDSDLYSRFQESFGITEATDLNNATDRARVIEQIKMHRKNHVDDNTSIIGSMKEGEYAAELTSVVQEKVQDGSFKVTAWDMASKESRENFKQKNSANLKAVSGGHSILAGAKKEYQDRIIGNTAVSMMRENGSSATAVKIQNAAFAANITEEDLANIGDDQIATMLGEGKTAENLTAKDKQFLGFVKASTNGNFGAVNPQNITKFKKQFTNVGSRVDAFERLSDQTIATGVENAGQKNALAQMATQDPTKAMDTMQSLSLQANFIAQGNLANPVVAERVGKRYEQYAKRNNMSNTDVSKASVGELATFLNEDALSSNLVMREMKNDGFDFAGVVNEDYNVMYTRTNDEASIEQELSLDAVKADSPESLYYAFANSNVEGKATITGDLFAKYADIESENSAGYKGAMTAIKGKVNTAELATFMNSNGLSENDVVSAYKKAELLGETDKEGFGVETLKKYIVQSDATDKAVLSAIATKSTPEQFETIAADLANTGLTEEQKGSLYSGIAKRGFDGLSKQKQDALLAQGYTKADLQGLSYYELTQRADGKSSKEIYETVRGKTEQAKQVDQVFEAQGALISTARVKEAIDAEGGSAEAAAFVADAYAGKVSLLSKDEQDAERRGAALKLIGDSKQEIIATSTEGAVAIQKAETHAAYKEYTTNSQYFIALNNVKNSTAYKKAQKAENFDEEAYIVAAMDKETDHGIHFRQGQKRIADVKAAARENAIIDIAVKDDEALAAQVVAHGQDAVELANKRRVAQVMGATSNSDKVTINDMYANAIANNNTLYNKANVAFRSVSGGKDLADVDVMTRNNFLANDFTATLSGRDADWFKEQKRSIDIDYLTKVGGPDIEAKIKRTDVGVVDEKTGQKNKIGVNYKSMGEYLDTVQAQGISIDQALKNDGLITTADDKKSRIENVTNNYANNVSLVTTNEAAEERRKVGLAAIGDEGVFNITTSKEGSAAIQKAQTDALHAELVENHSGEIAMLKGSKEYIAASKAEGFDEKAYVTNALYSKLGKGETKIRFDAIKETAKQDAIIDYASSKDKKLGAKINAQTQSNVSAINRERVNNAIVSENGTTKVDRTQLYAQAIASNTSIYDKANRAFRKKNGKDLSEVDEATRNNFLVNDYATTLTGNDKAWYASQKTNIDKMLTESTTTTNVDNMSVEELNKVIAAGMSQEQFDAIYNEAKHNNFGEEIGVFSDVKKGIIGEQLNAGTGLTPAVNYAGMSASEKQSFNYNKNLIQQSIRGDDNSTVLANAFRNTTLIDNDRHVEAIVAGSGKSKVEILKNNSAFVENARMQVINSNTHDSLRKKIENQYRADTGLKVEFKDLKEGERNAIYAQYLANDTFMKNNAGLADKFNKSVDTKISDMSTTATAEDFKKGLSDQDINNYLKTNEPVKDQLVEHVAANMTLGLDDETRKLREGEAVLGDSALTNQVALDMLDATVSNKGVNKRLLPEFVKTQAKVKQVREDTSIRRKLGLKANASQDEIENALAVKDLGKTATSEIDKTIENMGGDFTTDTRVTDMVKKDTTLLASLGLDKNASDYDISKAMFGEYDEVSGKFVGKHENADLVKRSVALNLHKDDVIKSVKTSKTAIKELGLDEKATDEQIFEAINTRTNASVARNAVSHRLATKKNKTDIERAAISLESGDGKLGRDYILKNETQLKSALAKEMFFTTDASGKTVLRENAKYGQEAKFGEGRGISDAFDSSISKLKGSSKAFSKGVYNGVTKDIDPNKAGADARADFFRSQTPDLINQVGFGKGKKKKQQIKGVSEAFDAFVKDVNGTRSERREKGAQAIWYKVTKKLPEQSAAYTNWNRVLEKKITDIKTGGGQYATMSRAAREAEVAKFEAQKIDTKLPANFAQMSSEEQRAYKEKQALLKHEALTTGNLSALYKTGTEVTAARRPGALKRFADNAGYSLGMSGKNMSQAVKDQHKQDLTDIDGQIARFNATRAMRNKNVDFGANFNTFVNNYLDNRSANTVIKQSNKQFLQQFKGQTDANGKKLDEDFKFADLTKEQQYAVVKIREDNMASHMNRLHQVASKKVAKDAGLDPTTYLEEKGIETETVRYKDGSKKYRHVQSKLHIPGLDRAITAKRVRDIKAYEEEYERTGGEVSEKTKRRYQKSYYGKRSLESTIQNQNRAIELQKTFDKVNEFNRNFKGNSSEYEAAFKKEFGPLAEQLYARYNSKLGKQFRANLGRSPVAVQQRAVTNELISEMKKTSDRMKFGSKYIPATAANGYAYVGKTMTGAKTRMEIELDRTNAADINKAYKQFSTERSALSYDSLFAKLKPSLQESFKAGKKKGFADMSEDQKKEALAKHLERELAKANNRVHNNNFLRSNASDLQRLNGVYIQRSKVNNSGVSRTMLKALTTNESKIYQNVVNNYNSALRKYEEEQKHMGRLGSALKEITSGVQSSGSRAQAKKIREQIETSSVRLSVLKKEYEMAAARKNEFEHRLIETKVKPVAGGAPVGYNSGRVKNIFNEYRFPRKDGKDIEPDSEQGRRIMWAVAYFMRRQRGHMDRIKLDIESMVRRNVLAESSRLNSRMNALIKRQSDNFGSTIRDLLESKKLLESEIKKLEGSTKAGDAQLRTELQIHYSRLDNEYEKLVKELGDVDVAISSVSAIAKKKK